MREDQMDRLGEEAYCMEKPSVARQDTELCRALPILSPFAAIFLDTVNMYFFDWFNKKKTWLVDSWTG